MTIAWIALGIGALVGGVIGYCLKAGAEIDAYYASRGDELGRGRR